MGNKSSTSDVLTSPELLESYMNKAKKGDSEAQWIIAEHYCSLKKFDSALRWAKKSTNAGNLDAKVLLGKLYIFLLYVPNKGIPLLQEAVSKENTTAMTIMSYCLYFGIGVERNDAKAVELATVAAKKGDNYAKMNLCCAYFFGRGTERNEKIGVQILLEMHSENCEPYVTNYLGFCYATGSGVDKDPQKAFHLFLEAYSKNFVLAFYNLEYLYKNGIGVTKDFQKAYEYRKKISYETEDEPLTVGDWFYYGEGVMQDKKEALKWFEVADKKGNLYAKKFIGQIQYELNQTPVGSTLEPIWQWNDNQWQNYDEETSKIIEDSFSQQLPSLVLNHGYYKTRGGFIIDFNTMTQTNRATGYVRSVQRIPTAKSSSPLLPLPSPRPLSPSVIKTTRDERRSEVPSARLQPGHRFLDLVPKAQCDLTSTTLALQSYATENHHPTQIITTFQAKVEDYQQELTLDTAFIFGVIWLYTTDSWVYKEVNSLLRNDSPSLSFLAPYINSLMRAHKLITVQDHSIFFSGTVFRRTKLTEKGKALYKVNSQFVWSAFTSTTKEFSESPEFGDVLFVITVPKSLNQYALSVEDISDFPSEREVLLIPNVGFRVRNFIEKPIEYVNCSIAIFVEMSYVCVV